MREEKQSKRSAILASKKRYGTMALRLQSSVHGKIRRLLMVKETDLSEEEMKGFINILLQIIINKNDIQLIIWSSTYEESYSFQNVIYQELSRLKPAANTNIFEDKNLVFLSPGKGRTIKILKWVRDPFLVFLNTSNNRTLLATPFNDDFQIVEELERERIVENYKYSGKFEFAGGDIINISKYILIGQATLTRTEFQLFGEKRIPAWLKRMLTIRYISSAIHVNPTRIVPIVIPERDSKLFGIDFFQRKNWFSSDVKLQKNNQEYGFIDPDLIHIDLFITATGESLQSKPLLLLAYLVNININDCQRIIGLNSKLDIIEESLASKFEIIRNPVPCVQIDSNDWVFLFYNNCIVSNEGEKKIAWLPDFLTSFDSVSPISSKLRSIQFCNHGIWRNLGFDIINIKADFIPFLTKKGGLHCLTNEIERDLI